MVTLGKRCTVTKLCLTLCDPMDCSTPGSPVLHYLLEFAQTHVQWVGDANHLTHPLPGPSPPALNLSQKTLHWVKEARHGSLHVAWMHLCHMYRRGTSTESRQVTAQGSQVGRGVLGSDEHRWGVGFLSGRAENSENRQWWWLHNCECIKNHWIAHFRSVTISVKQNQPTRQEWCWGMQDGGVDSQSQFLREKGRKTRLTSIVRRNISVTLWSPQGLSDHLYAGVALMPANCVLISILTYDPCFQRTRTFAIPVKSHSIYCNVFRLSQALN